MNRFLLVATIALSQLASADGIPTTDALVYSGVAFGTGGAVLAAVPVNVSLWDVETGGTTSTNKKCEAATPAQTDAQGRFRVSLAGCVTAVSQNANLFAEVSVSGVPLARTRLGASPYAVEALRSATTSQILTGNTTLEVGAGRQFATLGAALRWLDDRVVRGRLTIRIFDGNYAEPNTLTFDHPDGARVSIVGNPSNASAVTITFSSNVGLAIGPNTALAGLEGLTLRRAATLGDQYIGIKLDGSSHASLGPRLRVEGFANGVLAETNSSFSANDVVVVGAGTSMFGMGFGASRSSGAFINNCSASQVSNGYFSGGASAIDTFLSSVSTVTEGWRSSDNAYLGAASANFTATGTTFTAAGAGVLRAPTPLPAGATVFPALGSVGGQNAYVFQ